MPVYPSNMNDIVEEYLARVEAALAGSSDEGDQLVDEVVSVFAGTIPNVGHRLGDGAQALRVLRGRLLVFRGNGFEDPSLSAPSVSVSVSSFASFTALTREIDLSGLPVAEQAAAKDAVADMERSAKSHDGAAFCDAAVKFFNMVKAAGDAMKVIEPLISVLGSFMGAM